MDVEAGEFQDWEVLHNSDDSGTGNSLDSVEIMKVLEGIEGDSEGIIRSDYFSLDSHSKYMRSVPEDYATEEGSVESDNPSWIDPGSETRYPTKESGEFWSDSSSDRSDDRKFGDFDAKNELAIAGNDGIGEIVAENENLGELGSESGGIKPILTKIEIGDDAKPQYEMEFSDQEKINDGSAGGGGGEEQAVENENVAIEAIKSGGEVKNISVIWWKLPLELLKYCAFRVNPVWTFSVAAAVMGLVILGRRLQKMKRKSRSLQLKVTVDDKKVSQFMTRAARLNEAFSVVKRVPIIRPSLPAAGVTSWPMMSLR